MNWQKKTTNHSFPIWISNFRAKLQSGSIYHRLSNSKPRLYDVFLHNVCGHFMKSFQNSRPVIDFDAAFYARSPENILMPLYVCLRWIIKDDGDEKKVWLHMTPKPVVSDCITVLALNRWKLSTSRTFCRNENETITRICRYTRSCVRFGVM